MIRYVKIINYVLFKSNEKCLDAIKQHKIFLLVLILSFMQVFLFAWFRFCNYTLSGNACIIAMAIFSSKVEVSKVFDFVCYFRVVNLMQCNVGFLLFSCLIRTRFYCLVEIFRLLRIPF